ncbi:unnamed protein product [Prunus armeniaca]
MSVPHQLWGHAVLSAAYLINRTLSRVLDFKTPHDVLGDHVSLVSVSKGYKCYHSPTQKVHVTLDATFHEEVSYYVCPSSLIQEERRSELESLGLENDVFEDTTLGKETICRTEASDRSPISEDETCGLCEETTDRPLELNRSPISRDEAGALGVEMISHTEASDQSPIYENNDSDSCMEEFDAIPPSALPVPQSTRDSESSELHDVLSNPKWMDALNKNKTWDLVPLPRGKKAVGCKWVFTLKYKADGSIDRYKARLVAKGYTQTYGVDYLETFALVAKLNTVRVLLSLAANRDWPLLQFDVKNAFLHGDLKEEIYMDLPPSIPVTSKEGVVCKLIALIIYVDDMIVTGDDQAEMQNLQKYPASEFEMKSLGDLKYFIGIEVARSKHVSVVSQFMHSPSEHHMDAVMHILRYLKVTPGNGLIFCKYGHTDVEVYTDVDWAGSVTNRRSTSGYFTFVGSNLIT